MTFNLTVAARGKATLRAARIGQIWLNRAEIQTLV